MSELQKYFVRPDHMHSHTEFCSHPTQLCNPVYPVADVDAARAADKATIADLQERLARSEAAIRWALGEEGEFPDEPAPLAGKYRRRYHWRTELRARAGFAAADGQQDGR